MTVTGVLAGLSRLGIAGASIGVEVVTGEGCLAAVSVPIGAILLGIAAITAIVKMIPKASDYMYTPSSGPPKRNAIVDACTLLEVAPVQFSY